MSKVEQSNEDRRSEKYNQDKEKRKTLIKDNNKRATNKQPAKKTTTITKNKEQRRIETVATSYLYIQLTTHRT